MDNETIYTYKFDVSVIIPVFNEEKSISGVVSKIQRILEKEKFSYEIIVVNDGSQDNTNQQATAGGARVIDHAYNIGNGAAIKTGIRNARGRNLVFMDGDGQHNPEEIPHLLRKLKNLDMIVGARTRRSETTLHRDLANRIYNTFASYICNRKIPDLTSGFRAVRSHVAREFISLLPNTFSYPTTITLAVARSGYQYDYHPIQTVKRTGKSKIKLINDGMRFFVILFKIATLYSPLKIFIPTSLILFLLGFGYGLYKVLLLETSYGPTSAMLMTISGVVFLIGLVSEQITQLWFNQSSRTL
jgi:glycosyltransferase involved in cell wall biosynthesis